MYKGKIRTCVIFLNMVIFLILVVYSVRHLTAFSMEAFDESEEIAVSVWTGTGMRQIKIWKSDETQEAYFFLPSYAELANCCFVYDDESCSLYLGEKGQWIASGKFLKDISCNVPYAFEFQGKDENPYSCQVTFMKSENLPAIYLDTKGGGGRASLRG